MQRIGPVELDESTGELRSEGRTARLGLRPFDFLRRLAQSRGEVLRRDQLTAALWPDQVVGEAALGSVVREVRRALKSLGVAEAVRVEAIRGRGFRLAVADETTGTGLAAIDVPPESFVGREEELGRLEAALDAPAASGPRILVVSGAAGVGKTRLVEELQARLWARDVETLTGHCLQGETVPFAPWAQIVRAFSRSHEGEVVRAVLQPLAPELARVLPSVRVLFDDLAPARRDDPELARLALFDCFVELVDRIAERRPCVLVLDDVQWADSSSLHVLSSITRQPSVHRCLVVAIQRSDEVDPSESAAALLPDLIRSPRVEHLQLNPLSDSDSRRLLAALGARDGSDPRWKKICSAAEGNPLFLEEMYRHLGEAAPNTRIPPSIERLLLKRIEHRTPAARDVLASAAVIGAEVDPWLLSEVATGETSLDEALGELIRVGLLADRRELQGAYRFAHGLIQETVYAQIPPVRRARLHLCVAESVERRPAAGDRSPEDDVPLLAHHFERAREVGGAARAFHYRRRAGRAAMGRLAFEEAVFHFSRAVALLEGDGIQELADVDDETRCDLLLQLSYAARHAGDGHACDRAVEAALPLARALPDPQYLVRLVASIPFLVWHDPEHAALQEEALARLDDRPTSLRAIALAGLAERLSDLPGAAARRNRLIREALEITARDEGRAAREYVLDAYLAGQFDRGDLAKRERYATEWLRIGREQGGVSAQAQGHLFRHAAFLQGGRLADAKKELAEIDALARRHPWPRLRWLSSGLHFAHAYLDARLDEADEHALHAAEIGGRSRQALTTMALAIQLPFLRREQGRLTEIVELVDGFAASTPAFDWAAELVRVNLGDRKALARLLESTFVGRAGILRHDADKIRVVALCWLCDACSEADERAWAEALGRELAPAADSWGIGGAAGFYSLGSVRHVLGVNELLRGRPRVAVGHLERAVESHAQPGATLLRLWTTYELARALRARGWKKDADRVLRMIDDTYAAAVRLGLVGLQRRIETKSAESTGPVRGRPPKRDAL